MGSDPRENLFEEAGRVLALSDLSQKLIETEQLYLRWKSDRLSQEVLSPPAPIQQEAGRPEKPELVPPRKLKRRRLGSPTGHASMIHAIAHIEFNAINLALDAVYRFRDMPAEYYDDWLRIADEERYHFQLVQGRLNRLGFEYGDFPAHNGLWETAQQTAEDVLLRMGLVPRILEARGLDVNPGIMEKLREIGDEESQPILEVILQDEVGHVKAGTRWFRYLCEQRDLDADETFEEMVRDYLPHTIRGPFYEPGRRAAGFSDREMSFLQQLDQENRGITSSAG